MENERRQDNYLRWTVAKHFFGQLFCSQNLKPQGKGRNWFERHEGPPFQFHVVNSIMEKIFQIHVPLHEKKVVPGVQTARKCGNRTMRTKFLHKGFGKNGVQDSNWLFFITLQRPT